MIDWYHDGMGKRLYVVIMMMMGVMIAMLACQAPSALAATSNNTAQSLVDCIRTESFCNGGVLSSSQAESYKSFMSNNDANGRMKVIIMPTSRSHKAMSGIITSYFSDTSSLDSTAYGMMVIVYRNPTTGKAGFVVDGTNESMVDAFTSSMSGKDSDKVNVILDDMKPAIKAAVTASKPGHAPVIIITCIITALMMGIIITLVMARRRGANE